MTRGAGDWPVVDWPVVDSPVVDWVLRMARIEAGDFLPDVAAAGRLDPPLLEAIGDAIAAGGSPTRPNRYPPSVRSSRFISRWWICAAE